MTMSTTDYSQTAEDHRCMLVLVKQVGCHLKPKSYSRLYERVSKIQSQTIQNQQRSVYLRYKKFYTQKDNSWGDFQAHRKVLGLLCFGKCENQNEVKELVKLYETVKQDFKETLFNNRLILFGLNRDGTPVDGLSRSDSVEGEEGCDNQGITAEDEQNSNLVPESPLTPEYKVLPAYDKNGTGDGTGLGIGEGTVNGSPGGLPRTGSATKLGSLLPRDTSTSTILCFPSEEDSDDLEEKLQDFVSSLFWVLESKRLDRSHERLERVPLIIAPFERKDGGGADTDSRAFKKRCQSRLKKHLGDLCLLAGLPGEAILHYQTCMEGLRNANDWLWVAAGYEGLCAASVIVATPDVDKASLQRNFSFSTKRGSSAVKDAGRLRPTGSSHTLPNGVDLMPESKGLSGLATEDLTDKYREAVLHYSKFQQAGIIEIEASLKACRVLIRQQKLLSAADFLQNVVYINIPLTEDEKIHRFSTLSSLYGQLGMRRKSSFFKRIAAMQCVAPTNPKPAWVQCYHLLIQALDGYRLSLDYKDIPSDYTNGWPCVQLRVLHELIYSARRMGNPAIAIRHLSFLLHAMVEHLSEADKREMSDVLVSYTGRCEGTPQVLALDNGVILPPVPFYKFPQVRSFKLLDLPPHLRPVKIKKEKSVEKVSSSPFIYSPLQFGGGTKKDESKLEFSWVQGDVCEVAVQVSNPLPYELKASNVGLLTEGVEYEGYPASLSLPPESGPFQVKIMGTPSKTGELTVLGYTTMVLGVRSHCRLRDIPGIPVSQYEVPVVPALPKMQVTTSLPKAASFSSMADSGSVVTSATACLFAGQRCECQIMLTNNGKLPIENVHISLDSKTDKSILGEIVRWNDDNLSAQLPLPAGSQASFTLYLQGESHFVPSDRLHPSALHEARQNHSPLLDTDQSGLVSIEALLKLQYSGGPGLTSGYCRQCSVALTVEIQPSLVIQNWDVIPADSHENCHIILDFDNPSSEEIELCYSGDHTLSIDSKETCRVAIQIPRCDISSSMLDQVPLDGAPPDGGTVACRREVVTCTDAAPVSSHVQAVLTQHIANLLDIKYRTISTQTEGRINLSRLWWKTSQLSVLEKPAITWDVKIDDKSHVSGSRSRCLCGENVNLCCSLTNRSDRPICDSQIKAEVFRKLDIGDKEADITGDVVIIGSNKLAVTQIPAGESCNLDCTFLFLSPGRYCLRICCHGNIATAMPTSDAAQSERSADGEAATLERDAGPAQGQTWRYIPTVELSVRES